MTQKISDIKKLLYEKEQESLGTSTIEDVVKDCVAFDHYNPNDWNSVYCAVCGDGSRTQGPRGGWKFEGESARYNCFNCGIAGAFTPENEIFMSNDMKTIFQSFGIPKKEYAKILYRLRRDMKDGVPKKPAAKKESIEDLIGDGINMPDYLKDLSQVCNTNVGKAAIRLLEDKCIPYKDYPFFISTGETKSKDQQDKINSKILTGRLVIPIYYYGKLLLLQGRRLEENGKKKYINIGNVSSTLYGLDRLNKNHKYVFVQEGFFDAYHLNGVACITNKLTTPKVKMLNSIEKDKIIVPDRNEIINTMLAKGIDEGWGFSAPKELQNCKDTTEAVRKYGKMFTVHAIMKSAKLGKEAEFLSAAWLNSNK